MTTKYEADYVVIGAGAMSMAFVDTILDETDADVVIVDRYDKPGGHWRVAYEHVGLHQPASFYGVNSTPLGLDRVDTTGYNKGLRELASGDALRAYYEKVMTERFLASGRVTYLPNTEYLGEGRAVGTLSGDALELVARKRLVDGTYMKVSVPSVTPPPFEVADGTEVVPPNGLARVGGAYDRYTVIGGGKTGVDAVLFLLDRGVDPDKISWVVPRDAWMFTRAAAQPGPEFAEMVDGLVASHFGSWFEATSVDDLWDRLEACGYMYRLSKDVRPTVFKCATMVDVEIDALRRVHDVVRLGRVRRIEPNRMELEQGERALDGRVLYVNCTSNGLSTRDAVPVFGPGTITLQPVFFCQQVYSAAFIAHVEASYDDDAARNDLTAAIPHPEHAIDYVRVYIETFQNEVKWAADPDIVEWRQRVRLSGLTTRTGTPMPPAGPDRDAALAAGNEMMTAFLAKAQSLYDQAQRVPVDA